MVLGKTTPDFVKRLSKSEHRSIVVEFYKVIEEVKAPSEEYPERTLHRGKSSMGTRFIPEGIIPLCADEGFDHDVKLQSFYEKAMFKKVMFWGLGHEASGVYTGLFDDNLRHWIKSDFLHSPTCIYSSDTNIVMITDEVLGYTTISGPMDMIEKLDNSFGGTDKIVDVFEQYIASGDLGFGQADWDWARKFLRQVP